MLADEAMEELKRQIAADHVGGFGVHKTSDKANHRYRDGFVAGFVAAATAERAVSDKLLEALKLMEEEKSDYMIRNRLGDPSGETTNRVARAIIAEVEALRKEYKG